MALKHVVLAVVAESADHGYRIHARVLEMLPMARPFDTARVYRALGALEGAGLVRSSWSAGRGGAPGRKSHGILPPGEAELRRWLERMRPGPGLLRRGLLVQLAVDPTDAGERSAAERRWRPRLDERSRRRDRLSREVSGEGVFRRLVRLRELAHLEAEIRALGGLLGAAGDPCSPIRSPRALRDRSSAFR